MRTSFALLIAAGTLAAAPVPKDFRKADDRSQLAGRWAVVSVDAVKESPTESFEFTADGGMVTQNRAGYGGARQEWAFKIDPTANPKRMRCDPADGGRGFDCLYELSGDSLKLLWIVTGDQKQPKVEPGLGVVLYEMKRDRPAK